MKAPIILVDGSSYFYRAFHALPPLTNSKGQPTGAIYGVVNMIKRLLKDYKPEQLVVIFDAPGKTFRDEWYPEYKAHRPPTPPDLSCQFEPLISILKGMGIPLIIMPGVEADDVIGTLAEMASQQDIPVVISTSDKDMAQLVNSNVTLMNTMTNQYLDESGVQAKFGVTPQQMIDYLTLVGDTSDNVPGVTKCGPKTAVKWLAQYQTLDNLVANAHEITGKVGEYLREALSYLELSKRLVTIKTDLELTVSLQDLSIQPMNRVALAQLARELEFKTWLKEWSTEEQNAIPAMEETNAVQISSNSELIKTVQPLVTGTNTSITLHIDIQSEIKQFYFVCNDEPVVYYFLFSHSQQENWFETLKIIFEHPRITKIGYDVKLLAHFLKTQQIRLQGPLIDVMLEAYLLNSTLKANLSSLIQNFVSEEALFIQPIRLPLSIRTLHQMLLSQLPQSSIKILNDIEIPLMKILIEMESHGVLIDLIQLKKQGERLQTQLNILQQEAVELAQHPFNLNSPKQLLEVLYLEQKLPILAKTPTGQPSTSEAVLQELAYLYRLPAVILEYRSLNKLVSTYIDALPKRVNSHTQRVHTCYNQAVTATGRLSSTDPNLQNIPIRHSEGRLIRKAFVAPEKKLLLSADYSQIELRIMAHLSQDPQLQLAFSKGLDIHTATASEIFDIPLDIVTSEQRRRAKAVNFGLIYGMSSFGLAKQLGIDRTQAQQYINRYFDRYPGVLNYMQQAREIAQKQGFVETLIGRRLYIPDIHSQNKIRQKAAERIAINAPLQGTAAEIIKKAMIDIQAWKTQSQNTDFDMILQVHDELVFEVNEHCIDLASTQIKNLMENAMLLSVPLEVTIGIGKNWDEAH